MWAPAAPPALPPPGRQTAGSSGWSHAAGQAPFPAGRAPFSQQPPRGGGSLPSPWQLQRRSSRLVAGAGVRDRGEWTRFLEWNDSGDGVSAGTRASVECVLLDAESAAEVTVTAPDRPGLLSDISRAIASTGFNIDKARVTTPSAVVKNTFRVTSADGGALSEERLRALRKAVVTCASKSYSTLKSVAASSKMSDVNVEVMTFEPSSTTSRPQWVIRVTAVDAPGALSTMVGALFTLGMEVVSAEVRTTADGRVNNQFQVIKPDSLAAGDAAEALKAALAKAP